MGEEIKGCVIFTNLQKKCYDWLIKQGAINGVIEIHKNADWARVILHGEETAIGNPMGWSKEDFYE